jgi:hypothetical protein
MWDRLPVWEKKSAVMAANEGRRTLSIWCHHTAHMKTIKPLSQ